jgi:hypothetical protein
MTVSLRSWSRDVRRSSHVPLFNVYICSSMANSRVVVTNHCALNLTQLYYGFLSCLLSQAQVFKAAVTESHPGSQTFWKHLIVAPQRRLPLTAYPHLHLSLWISLGTCALTYQTKELSVLLQALPHLFPCKKASTATNSVQPTTDKLRNTTDNTLDNTS